MRITFRENGLTDIEVDGQHLSRLQHREVRELVLQVLVFGGKQLREEVHKWLNEGKIQSVAEVVSASEFPSQPYSDTASSGVNQSTGGDNV